MSFVCSSNSVGLGARFHLSKKVALDVSYFKTLYKHYDKSQADYNGIKANFGNILTGVKTQVEAVAQEIVAEDMKAGINPQTDPRMAVFSQLNGATETIAAAQTPGHDRMHRTNDVIGVAVSVSF